MTPSSDLDVPAAHDEAALHGLLGRVDALERGLAIARRHDLDLDLDPVAQVVATARARLRHGSSHTVIALAGPTGSGKSSLLNALTGTAVAPTGVRRPTTTTTHAVVVPGSDGAEDTDGLLDWLGVSRRHHLRPTDDGPDVRGLVLLDLPDVDSTVEDHRREVERLVALVDLTVWVVDPQKYADHALHAGFLAPLAPHAAVVDVVLNKADTLDEDALRACLADLDRLLDADGLLEVRARATSATTGHGMEELRDTLAAEVAARRAMVDRVESDLAAAADHLGDEARPVVEPGWRDRRALVNGLSRAVGAAEVADLVAAQHVRDARLRTGWPPLRWLRRVRRAPIEALPVAAASPVARAEVSTALRSTGDAAADGVEAAWRPAVRRATGSRLDEVVAALDGRTSTGVHDLGGPSRWWTPVAGLHRVLLATAVIGALWLVGLAVADGLLRLDVDAFAPTWRGVALPTWLLLGGVGGGLLLALLSRPLAAAGGRRRAARARHRIHDDVAAVAATEVLGPLDEVLDDRRELAALQARARGLD